jgi:hypothetical protein
LKEQLMNKVAVTLEAIKQLYAASLAKNSEASAKDFMKSVGEVLEVEPELGLTPDELFYQEGLIHRGVSMHRVKDEPESGPERREKALSDMWHMLNADKQDTGHHFTLATLLAEDGNQGPWSMKMKSPFNQAAASAAATAIQWLGSPVGFGYLERAFKDAGYEIKAIG